jgi:hypothetical protein
MLRMREVRIHIVSGTIVIYESAECKVRLYTTWADQFEYSVPVMAQAERVYGHCICCDCVVVPSEDAAVAVGYVVLLSHLSLSINHVQEKRIALPLGIVFWVLSLLCLSSGLANYIQTVTRYSKREAIVQTGWKTHIVFTVVSTSIVATCVLFLYTNSQKE